MKKEDVKVKKLNNKGFSLVEIIIVIAIMAVLAGALAPQLIKYIDKSRKAADIQTAQTIAMAANTALADEAGYATAKNTKLSDCYNSSGTNAFQDKIKEILGGTSGVKPKSKEYADFLITYSAGKGIEIYATNEVSATPTPVLADQLYPELGDKFK